MNFSVSKCGLIINRQYPHLGATPDALISCDCCGKNVAEIKCPFRCKEQSIAEVASTGDFCLKVSPDGDGELSLDKPTVITIKCNSRCFCRLRSMEISSFGRLQLSTLRQSCWTKISSVPLLKVSTNFTVLE